MQALSPVLNTYPSDLKSVFRLYVKELNHQEKIIQYNNLPVLNLPADWPYTFHNTNYSINEALGAINNMIAEDKKIIVKFDSEWASELEGKPISDYNHVIIEVTFVLVPGAKLQLCNGEPLSSYGTPPFKKFTRLNAIAVTAGSSILLIDDPKNQIEIADPAITIEEEEVTWEYHNDLVDEHDLNNNLGYMEVRNIEQHISFMEDVWHALKRISTPKILQVEFERELTDAVILLDQSCSFMKLRIDLVAVTKVLESQGKTFSYERRKNKEWVQARIRRVVSPPKKIIDQVYNVIMTFSALKYAATQQSLCTKQSSKEAENFLTLISSGYLSYLAVISLYQVRRKDKHDLNVYRCLRGTNSLEGGVHQNLNRRFDAFNASVKLAFALMTEYKTRHNLDVDVLNRTGKAYKSHYDIWLKDKTQLLNFDISMVTGDQIEDLGFSKYAKTGKSDRNIDLLSRRQGTLFPILPVHTDAEKKYLFREMITDFYNNAR
ncbi:hypothetical protein INT45_001501 [Circinella minor]|uniref:Uncharacterized protein n=1 Tax=Circinella minor TaxID=1195481 RepID=A0A8H7VNB3_9FUNG|nr:hypothetical protein INT45_001501 [Circinella minor]